MPEQASGGETVPAFCNPKNASCQASQFSAHRRCGSFVLREEMKCLLHFKVATVEMPTTFLGSDRRELARTNVLTAHLAANAHIFFKVSGGIWPIQPIQVWRFGYCTLLSAWHLDEPE